MEEDVTPAGSPAHPIPNVGQHSAFPGVELQLAECLVTRLCHDLSGAMSTMQNALSIAIDDPEATTEALSLADEGAQAVNARLRLLRAAWGGSLGATTLPSIMELMDGLPTRRRLKIETDVESGDAPLPGHIARTLLNVLLLAAENLPHGGNIAVAGEASAQIVVTIGGRGASWPPGLSAWLTSREVALAALSDPRQIAGPLTALLAEAEGVRVSMLMGGPPEMVPPLLISVR
jgi:histidine phosphotransferase ChpT